MDGAFRDVRMSAQLVGLDGVSPEAAITKHLAGWARPTQLATFSTGRSWVEAERLLKKLFLNEPFGQASLAANTTVVATKFELAFQATDMIMFLAKDHEPKSIYHFTMANAHLISGTGCAIQYDSDLLVINHVRWRRSEIKHGVPEDGAG